MSFAVAGPSFELIMLREKKKPKDRGYRLRPRSALSKASNVGLVPPKSQTLSSWIACPIQKFIGYSVSSHSCCGKKTQNLRGGTTNDLW